MQLTELKGIGPKTEEQFRKAGIQEVMDLLLLFPRDYEVFQPPTAICGIGYRSFATIQGAFTQGVTERRVNKLLISQAVFQDEFGESVRAVWFNAPFIKNSIRCDIPYVIRGRVSRKYGSRQIDQPRIYRLGEYDQLEGSMQPVYSLTKGLSAPLIKRTVQQALESPEFLRLDEEDVIPSVIRKELGLWRKSQAIKNMHFPGSKEALVQAMRRMAFEEIFLFLYQMKKSGIGRKSETDLIVPSSKDTEAFLKRLPFTLTPAQQKVVTELAADMNSGYAMNRLIQGDVGSGKTIVALTALMNAAFAGYQGALMVPTEVLAAQHYETITKLFASCEVPLKAALLTGSATAKEKKAVYQALKDGEINLLIGTHALIQEKVHFKNLALVVTDEQHRFGIKQREALMQKAGGKTPHMIVMSATPIPRTMALILYSNMDVSIIDQLPTGRKPIKNAVVDDSYHENAWRFIAKQVAMGHQAYIICPLVEYSEGVDAANADDYTEMLKGILDPSIRVEKLTGPMPSAKKNEIMTRFAQGNIDVLVSTTVIEVGVDVPNATVMMVEDANRFGLAALHQLRGRVGRGKDQSYCIFVSGSKSEEAMQRLEILNNSNNGFEIAQKDLEMRGPGELLGIRQSGELPFTSFDIYRDAPLAAQAADYVERILAGSLEAEPGVLSRLEEKSRAMQGSILL